MGLVAVSGLTGRHDGHDGRSSTGYEVELRLDDYRGAGIQPTLVRHSVSGAIGFKVLRINRFRIVAEAHEYLTRDQADLVLVGASQATNETADAIEFARWLRRSGAEASRTTPVMLLAVHTSEKNVRRARDNGINFMLARPMTLQVLYDRILWLSRDARKFIVHDSYVGPDRRFQNIGPPADTMGRRRGDLSLSVGEAKAANLSQSEIDAFLGAKTGVPVA